MLGISVLNIWYVYMLCIHVMYTCYIYIIYVYMWCILYRVSCVMLCHFLLCYVMGVVLYGFCYVALCSDIFCDVMLYSVLLWLCVMLLCSVLLCHVILSYLLLRYVCIYIYTMIITLLKKKHCNELPRCLSWLNKDLFQNLQKSARSLSGVPWTRRTWKMWRHGIGWRGKPGHTALS